MVIPTPSCPDAIHSPGLPGTGPTTGRFSGVAGGNPAQVRTIGSCASPGTNSIARGSIGGDDELFDQVSQGLLEVSLSPLNIVRSLDKLIYGDEL